MKPFFAILAFAATYALWSPTVSSATESMPEHNDKAAYWAEQERAEIPDKIKKLRPQAEKGDVDAQWRLGMLYVADSTAHDDAEAFKWLYIAAQKGAVSSSLATLYLLGKGVKQDYVEAWYWSFRTRFSHSDLIQPGIPQYAYESLTFQERRSVRNRVAAVIDQTDGYFLHLLGADAIDAKDYEDAYFWYSLASRPNVNDSISRDLLSKQLQSAQKMLTPEQIGTVDTRVAKWKSASPPTSKK